MDNLSNMYNIIEDAYNSGGYILLTLKDGKVIVDPDLGPGWENLPYLSCVRATNDDSVLKHLENDILYRDILNIEKI